MASTTSTAVRSRSVKGLSGLISHRSMTSEPMSASPRSPQSFPVASNDGILERFRSTSAVGRAANDKNRSTAAMEEQQKADRFMKSPPVAPLLLEGDDFCISRDGLSRTYYELVESASVRHPNPSTPFSVEELHYLEQASKTFILRKKYSSVPSVLLTSDQEARWSSSKEDATSMGEPVLSFDLQEIDHGVLGSAGTGATTWESSIAMSMFFSMYPELLFGDVLELGSGVGLGGIVSHLQRPSEMKSFAMTDYNAEVINQCEKNIVRAQLVHNLTCEPRLSVRELNWYDFVEGAESSPSLSNYHASFDTVVASDCAYAYPDIVALSHAMKKLLRRSKKSRVHIFGPYNRSALLELIMLLREERKMNVGVEEFCMNRFRLRGSCEGDGDTRMVQHAYDEYPFVSKKVATFLHITASLHQGGEDDDTLPSAKPVMDDID